MKASKDIILREVAGEYILIPVGKAASRIHGMIRLSESGHLLWNILQNDVTKEHLLESFMSEYDIDKDTAEADVNDFLDRLISFGLVE